MIAFLINHCLENFFRSGVVVIIQFLLMQEPLILEAKGIKIGFLGYCDSPSYKQNCTEIRKLYNAGPAIYSDVIAARDVNNLRKVLNYLIIKSYGCTFSVFNLIGLLERVCSRGEN